MFLILLIGNMIGLFWCVVISSCVNWLLLLLLFVLLVLRLSSVLIEIVMCSVLWMLIILCMVELWWCGKEWIGCVLVILCSMLIGSVSYLLVIWNVSVVWCVLLLLLFVCVVLNVFIWCVMLVILVMLSGCLSSFVVCDV